MSFQLTYDIFNAVGPIVNTEVGQNFIELRDKFGAIDLTDIARNAGIIKEQIADKYLSVPIPIVILPPYRTGTVSDTPDVWTLTMTSPRQLWWVDIVMAPGQRAWIASIRLEAGTLASGPSVPRVTFYKNGTAITASSVDLTTAGVTFAQQAADPLTDVIETITNGDRISAELEQSGASNPTTEYIIGTLTLKVELTGE